MAGVPAKLFCMVVTVMLSCQVQAYLLEKDPDANAGAVWERVEKREYQLCVKMCGGGVLYPDDKYELPVVAPLLFIQVPGKGNFSIDADIGNGRGAWSKINGQRQDVENKTSLMINGLLFGMQVAQNITAEEDTIIVDYRVQVVTPIPKIGSCGFGTVRFERRPEGLAFTAETEEGKKTGDLCQAFEKIKNLKRLEIRTARKIIVYDFGTVAGVELEMANTPPGHPTVATLMIRPKDIHLDKAGETFGYRITIKISPAP